jgi:amino acid permease
MEPNTNTQSSPVTPESIPIETPKVYHTISGGPITYKETLQVKDTITRTQQAVNQTTTTAPVTQTQNTQPVVQEGDGYIVKICYQLYILIALISTLLPAYLHEDVSLFLTPIYYVFGFSVFILLVVSIKNIVQGKGLSILLDLVIFIIVALMVYFGLTLVVIKYVPLLPNLTS